MPAVTVAYRRDHGWSLVQPALYDDPPPGACRVRLCHLHGEGDEIRVVCGRAALDLDSWGEPHIGRRAERWLIDIGYARKAAGRLLVDWQKVRQALAADSQPTRRASAALAVPAPTLSIPVPPPERKRSPMDSLDLAPGLALAAHDFSGASVAVFGKTGSGKTTTLHALLTRLSPFVPFLVVDYKGEYRLRHLGAVVFGAAESSTVDVAVGPEDGGRIADLVLDSRKSAVIDLSRFDPEDDEAAAMSLVAACLKRLWQRVRLADEADRRPVILVIEEAQMFLPQSGKSPVKGILRSIAKIGRALGVTIFFSTQRPADMDKAVATQAEIFFLHRVTFDNDRARYAEIVPSRYMPQGQNIKDESFSLAPGEAFVLHADSLWRGRITPPAAGHGGRSVQIGQAAPPEEAAQDPAAIAEIRAQFARPAEPDADPDSPAALRAKVERLQGVVAEKDREIARLQALAACQPAPLAIVEDIQPFAPPDRSTIKTAIAAPAPRALVPTVIADESGQPFNADPLDAAIARRERQTADRLRRKQELEFGDLLEAVRRWTGAGTRGTWQRDFLTLLVRHGTVSRAQAVSWLKISDRTFGNNPPTPLIKASLISVGGRRGNYTYTWDAPRRLALRFPDLDARDLERKLLA